MKKIQITVFLFFLVSISSCNIISIYPFYTDEEVVTNDNFEGSWKNRGEIWKFTALRKKGTFRFRIAEEKNPEQIIYQATVTLFKINNYTFADIHMGNGDLQSVMRGYKAKKSHYCSRNLIAGHILYNVVIRKNKIYINYLGSDFMKKYIPRHKIKHFKLKNRKEFIITDPREFIGHLKKLNLFHVLKNHTAIYRM